MKPTRQNARNRTSTKAGTGWAWKIRGANGRWMLCSYAEPFRADLTNRPTPDAEIIRVAIVPIGVWRHAKARKDVVSGR